MPKKIKKYDDAYKARAVRLAAKSSAPKAAVKLGISEKNIYNWRTQGFGETKAQVKSKPKKRIQRTDDQKRLILRAVRETSVAETAERFSVAASSIHAWKKSGLRPARVKKRKVKKPTNGHPVHVRSQDNLEVQQLRAQIGELTDENSKLKDKLIEYVIHE